MRAVLSPPGLLAFPLFGHARSFSQHLKTCGEVYPGPTQPLLCVRAARLFVMFISSLGLYWAKETLAYMPSPNVATGGTMGRALRVQFSILV